MEMREMLESWLTELSKKDSDFARVFRLKNLGACERYATAKARAFLHGKNGSVPDSQVMGWAVEFFTGAEPPLRERLQAPEVPEETWEKAKQAISGKKKEPEKEDEGFTLFDFI